jgi:hypothetical protein
MVPDSKHPILEAVFAAIHGVGWLDDITAVPARGGFTIPTIEP